MQDDTNVNPQTDDMNAAGDDEGTTPQPEAGAATESEGETDGEGGEAATEESN